MDTYEYPLGVTFRASTPEHAAARVFGGKPGDYLVTMHSTEAFMGQASYRYAEVMRVRDNAFMGDIPQMVN